MKVIPTIYGSGFKEILLSQVYQQRNIYTSCLSTCQSWWQAGSWLRHYWQRSLLQATSHRPLAPEPTGPWWCRWYTGSLTVCRWLGQQMQGSAGSSCSLSSVPYWSWTTPTQGCCQQQWQEKVIQWGRRLWWPEDERVRRENHRQWLSPLQYGIYSYNFYNDSKPQKVILVYCLHSETCVGYLSNHHY